MKRVLTAVILIPLVLFLVFLGPEVAVAIHAGRRRGCRAGWLGVSWAWRRGRAKPPRVAVLVALLALVCRQLQWPDRTAAIFGILSLALLVYCTFFRPVEQVMADASASVFCLLYVGFTLIALPALREETNGPSLVAFLLCVVWAGDIAALYVGRAWGRRKLAPTLSPNKTWEGALGSVAGSLLVDRRSAGPGRTCLADVGLGEALLSERSGTWLGLAVVVNVAAQVGDLAESALKRSAGVKDSGSLLPGHGGVLDRIDALLLAAPVLWYAQVIHQGF